MKMSTPPTFWRLLMAGLVLSTGVILTANVGDVGHEVYDVLRVAGRDEVPHRSVVVARHLNKLLRASFAEEAAREPVDVAAVRGEVHGQVLEVHAVDAAVERLPRQSGTHWPSARHCFTRPI